jgi:hypothetical protein
MRKDSYQIRWRGKVSGPHDLESLKSMLSRGEVSLLHEVLVESQWISLEQLVSRKLRGPDVQPVAAPKEADPQSLPPKPKGPPPIPSDKLYHVARQGRAQGPYPRSALKQLVSAGILDVDDPAWTEGMPTWQPLKEIVELGVLYPAAVPPTANTILESKSVSGARERRSNQLAAGMAGFALYHSNEVRKELREMNDNLQELQDDSGTGDGSDGNFSDFSDM